MNFYFWNSVRQEVLQLSYFNSKHRPEAVTFSSMLKFSLKARHFPLLTQVQLFLVLER